MQTRILINTEKCILCKNCIEVCGSNTLEIIEKELVQSKPDLCSVCGHCAVVCPTDAITANERSPLFFKLHEPDSKTSDFEKLLLTKRSVRKFNDKDISKDILKKFVQIAEKAPSSSNSRKREYIIVTDKERILELEKSVVKKFTSLLKILNPALLNLIKLFSKKMYQNLSHTKKDILQMNKQFKEKNYPIFRNSAALVFILAPKNSVQSQDDCIIAQQYMMLYAHSQDISSCIIGYAQYAHKAIEKVLNIKKGYSIFAVSTYGYAKYEMKKEIRYNKKVSYKII